MPVSSSCHFSVSNNFITLHCTDADPSIRPPTDREQMVLSDGTVDFMHKCKGADPTLVLWRTKLGTFLADVVLELPAVKGRKKYILSSLPAGYALFIHKKGDKFDPRHDAYLWGSKTGAVFRSPAEFFFHAKWLLLGCPKPDPSKPLDEDADLFGPTPFDELTDRCGCKYCAGTDQGYISRKYSNYTPKRKLREVVGSFNARFEGS